MSTPEIKNALHEWIDTADDRMLHAVYAMVQADQLRRPLPEAHQRILDERLKAHAEHPEEGSSWQEVRARIESKL